MRKEPAHVFVTKGNLATLACDAVVISTDSSLSVGASWRALSQHRPTRPQAFKEGVQRAFAVAPAPGDNRDRVFANVGAWEGVPVSWFVDGGRQAVRQAAVRLKESASGQAAGSATTSERPLVALPLFGTGRGGGQARTGALVQALLPALQEEAFEHGLDVALVLASDSTYAAVQSHRHAHPPASFAHYLPDDLRKVGAALALSAAQGNLVLFIGAGASQGAGLPTWSGLLDTLADEAGLTREEKAQFQRLDALDQGRLVSLRFDKKRQDLGHTIAMMFKEHRTVPLTQAMLASLPVNQVATTNYDRLFEWASLAAGKRCGVLPFKPKPHLARWLLKLHGCVTTPDQIVLTRDDYLRFSASRAALAGIVQALMLTRHMLFVGFSLNDDNFHRIVHDVRSTLATSARARRHFGTALSLDGNDLKRELWQGDVDVQMIDGGDTPAGRRRLRILLDYVGMEAANGTAHILDDRYDEVLSGDERVLREALTGLIARLPADTSTGPWATAAGRNLRHLLSDMGAWRADRR